VRRAVVLGLALTTIAAAPLFPNGRAAIDPGRTDRSAADCADCHAQQHAELQGSRHAQSWSNPNFQAAFAVANLPEWCVTCHAPLGPDVAFEGVNCVACHIRDGVVLAAGPSPGAPHPIRVEPTLVRPEFCGGCHQFDAPIRGRPPGTPSGSPQQDTVHEWSAWAAGNPAAATCVTCHMDQGTHAFPGSHDPALMRSAVDVTVDRLDGTRVRATLTPALGGHDVPTGDPARRLVLQLCADAACAEPVAHARFWREFAETRRSWALVRDTTLVAGSATVRELDAPGAGFWRLDFDLAEPAFEAELPVDEAHIVLATGTIGAR
jgi:hypothetical protein